MVGIGLENIVPYYKLVNEINSLKEQYVKEWCEMRILMMGNCYPPEQVEIHRMTMNLLFFKIRHCEQCLANYCLRENWRADPFSQLKLENDRR